MYYSFECESFDFDRSYPLKTETSKSALVFVLSVTDVWIDWSIVLEQIRLIERCMRQPGDTATAVTGIIVRFVHLWTRSSIEAQAVENLQRPPSLVHSFGFVRT